jgi:hypothetical protein
MQIKDTYPITSGEIDHYCFIFDQRGHPRVFIRKAEKARMIG